MLFVSLIVGVGVIMTSLLIAQKITFRKASNSRLTEIAGYIRQGANAYLFRQIKTILLVTPFLFLLLVLSLGWEAGITSVIGVFTSLLSALFGMSICVRANLHTADLAYTDIKKSFSMAFYGGSVMGLLVTGFSLAVLSVLYMVYKNPESLIGFGFGASLAALFGQIGGGIFTKSADVGADIVGKVEAKIPEDDPRNPAVIADLVGDNVGDCAGRGADLFQTFSDDIITGTIVAILMVPTFGHHVIFFPLLLQCIGVISSFVAIISTRFFRKTMNPVQMFNIGIIISSFISFAGSFLLCRWLLHSYSIWIATVFGSSNHFGSNHFYQVLRRYGWFSGQKDCAGFQKRPGYQHHHRYRLRFTEPDYFDCDDSDCYSFGVPIIRRIAFSHRSSEYRYRSFNIFHYGF